MNGNEKIYIYGAGTQNLRMVYQPLDAAGYHISAIVDRDADKIGKKFYGIGIVSPEQLIKDVQKEDYCEIIISVRTKKIVLEIQSWLLQNIKNAKVYTFEEFVCTKKLNCHLKKFSCVMWHLVDHCNLDCVRCSHFSPLDKKRNFYLSTETFEKEVSRLSKLTGGELGELQFSGGETLLHPEAYKFPYIARKWFPNTQIIFITNGTRILAQDDRFFESCRENQAQIWISHYPIGLDYKKIEKKLINEGVDFTAGNSGNDDKHPKQMWGVPFVLDGDLDGKKNFESCLCMQYMIRDGKMYPCPNAAYVDLFNNYFNKSLPGPECNGVNIYEVADLAELTTRLSQYIPLCDYCDALHRLEGIPWRISKKEISEWTIT